MQKLDRLNWCLGNINNNFYDYLFGDETSIWENECPKYGYRPMGSYPDSVQMSSKSSKKLNLWCAISYRGATDFVVKS
jgi:hypothetical protein